MADPRGVPAHVLAHRAAAARAPRSRHGHRRAGDRRGAASAAQRAEPTGDADPATRAGAPRPPAAIPAAEAASDAATPPAPAPRPRAAQAAAPQHGATALLLRVRHAGGADHGPASRTRHGLDQLPDRHEPRRRPEPGAGAFQPDGKFTVALSAIDLGQGMKQVTRQICGRDARRADRRRLRRHRRLRHRPARHGQLRLARHASRRQRRDGGGARRRAA